MDLIAALDIGSEKTVMAVAEDRGTEKLHLSAIKMIASQGVEKGVVKDKAILISYVQHLLHELDKQKKVSRINVSISGQALQVSEHKINVPIQRKAVKENDLIRAELKCREFMEGRSGELIDIQPVAYYIDRETYTAEPLGKTGKSIDVRFRVYKSDSQYLSELRGIFAECGLKDVHFFPGTRAYMEALEVTEDTADFALVDIGASHIGVMLFRKGVAIREAMLPLGSSVLDKDIMAAYPLKDVRTAKELKHKKGSAIRNVCRSEKIQIPEINKQIDRKELALVIQYRMEELLEGVVYQLQQWKYTDKSDKIYLTGGGSGLADTAALLSNISGQNVVMAKAKNVNAEDTALLSAPACLDVLGLLSCEHIEPEEEKGGWGSWISGFFK
ncbi:cell division protein FtsA [Porphyromonadaceae bacterium OttesenSCG-928-L07]|nr:cell division protein FtsA [Porphyromonadaceae bacterium OttesenSCG-928-L07]MDL2251716.1 cell division protein FtsA [Odoribacter sp. OttesenSCG-928-J03]MDL2330994.1 cell division protein FtsA [Odoribacter sp. OttesenSCG-928-A06]